jgi:hypothetical protein
MNVSDRVCADAKTGTYSGFLVSVLQALAEELGASFEFVPVEYGFPFAAENGVYTTLSESMAVLNGTADVEIAPVIDLPMVNMSSILTDRRITWASSPFINLQSGGLVHKSSAQKSAFALFEPFDWSMWLALAIALAGYAVLIMVISGRARRANAPSKLLSGATTSTYHVLAACLCPLRGCEPSARLPPPVAHRPPLPATARRRPPPPAAVRRRPPRGHHCPPLGCRRPPHAE